MGTITKRIFLNTLFCPRIGWKTAHEVEPVATTLATNLRLLVGREIGDMARKASGPGELIDDKDITDAVRHTQRAMTSAETIYEATFNFRDFVTRVDILKRRNQSWDLYEVKSSMNTRQELVEDLAYTSTVVSNAGVPLGRTFLRLISREYEYQGPAETAFADYDATDQVTQLMATFASAMPSVVSTVAAKGPPSPNDTH